MDHVFLEGVEEQAKSTPMGQELLQAEKGGAPIPQILYLFMYKPALTDHLAAFTHELMRGPGDFAPGMRELVAAYTSRRNDCLF